MKTTGDGLDGLKRLVEELHLGGTKILVGVIAGQGGEELRDEGGLTIAGLATVAEFGATIDHPGGTPYDITESGAVFLSKSSPRGIAATAAGRVTKPHEITIPERAPVRKTIDRIGPKLNRVTRRILTRVVAGEIEQEKGLDQIGAYFSSQIQRTIQRGVGPPNAASTVRAKRSSRPLVDEGILVRSYTHKVVRE